MDFIRWYFIKYRIIGINTDTQHGLLHRDKATVTRSDIVGIFQNTILITGRSCPTNWTTALSYAAFRWNIVNGVYGRMKTSWIMRSDHCGTQVKCKIFAIYNIMYYVCILVERTKHHILTLTQARPTSLSPSDVKLSHFATVSCVRSCLASFNRAFIGRSY